MDKVLSASTHGQPYPGMEEMYERYRLELSRYIASNCRCAPVEVEDIVQSAFARFQAKVCVDEIENPKAFLFKTAYNIAIDMVRHKKVQDDYVYSEGQTVLDNTHELGPEKIVESRQRLGIIAKALWRMPAKRRQLLLMNRCENLSYAEIARQIGISEAAVRKHVSKALQDCHKALQP